MNKKLLSIVLPVFNGLPYINKSVDSILNQDFNDFNLIIVNDGSTDQTLSILNNIQDPRVKILNKKHTGIIDSFNIALNYVDTKYVSRVDADDYYYPSKIDQQIKFLESSRDICLVGTGAHYMTIDGKVSRLRIKVPQNHNDIIHDIFNLKRGIIHSSIVIRTNIIKNLDGYAPDIYPEDYELYFRVGNSCKFANIPTPLMAVRIHDSYTHLNVNQLIEGYCNLIQKYSKQYDITLSLNNLKSNSKTVIINRTAINNLLNGKPIRGLIKIFISFLINPKRIINHLLS